MTATVQKMTADECAKVVSHSRYFTFQMAEVAVPRELYEKVLQRILRLKPIPV